jgi:hypothetical protein
MNEDVTKDSVRSYTYYAPTSVCPGAVESWCSPDGGEVILVSSSSDSPVLRRFSSGAETDDVLRRLRAAGAYL